MKTKEEYVREEINRLYSLENNNHVYYGDFKYYENNIFSYSKREIDFEIQELENFDNRGLTIVYVTTIVHAARMKAKDDKQLVYIKYIKTENEKDFYKFIYIGDAVSKSNLIPKFELDVKDDEVICVLNDFSYEELLEYSQEDCVVSIAVNDNLFNDLLNYLEKNHKNYVMDKFIDSPLLAYSAILGVLRN
jgi:hypothetical protein